MKTESLGISAILVGSLVFSAPCFSASDPIGFSVKQDADFSSIRLTILPDENVRLGDRLIIVDESADEDVKLYALPFSDTNHDGAPDNVEIQIPFGSKHAFVVNIAPMDAQTGTVYCGLSAESWQGDFSGTGTEEINITGAQKVSLDEACPNGYFNPGVNLRVEHAHIAAEAPKTDTVVDSVLLESFVCHEVSYSPLGDCSKRQIAREKSGASVALQDVASGCSVTAQVVYAEDRDRVIAGKESVIRMAGYCPGGYTGVGFDATSATNTQQYRIMSLSNSIIKWIVDKVSKALGKKTAKEVDKALRKCEIPHGLFWKILSVIPYIGELLVPCVAS